MIDGSYIFLSYRREAERDFPLRLARDLKNHGVRVWMDVLDIQTGENWENAIEQALDNCNAIIAVLSPSYSKSKWCRRELNRADSLEHPIFSVLLDTVLPTDRPIQVQTTQDIDFRRWRDENVYSSRLTELIGQLQNSAAAQLGPMPDPETRHLTQLIAGMETSLAATAYVDLGLSIDASPRRPSSGQDSTARPGESGASPQRFERIEDVIKSYPRLVLLGEAGAGKTTTLRHLALDQARARRDNPGSVPVPLLLDLAQWGDEATPLDFVRAHWLDSVDPRPALIKGDVSLYLDGLNETAMGERKARRLREWFQGDEAPRSAVVTCRLSDYDKYLDLDLPAIVVEPLDAGRIRRFANDYLDARANGFLARVLPEDNQARRNAPHLAQLATNPFLLTALMRLYRHSRSGDLPNNNGAIVAGLVEDLWTRAESRQKEWAALSEMEAGFGRLALAMIEEGQPAVVPREHALERVGDEELLRAGASAHIIEVQSGHVRFYHPWLLDYFAAVSLQQGTLDYEWVDKRVTAPSFTALAPGHTADRIAGKWGHVIIALTGITANPEPLLCQVLGKNPYLAAMCIGTGVSVTATTSGQIVDRLLAVLGTTWRDFDRDGVRSAYLDRRAAAIMALRQLGRVAVPALRQALKGDDSDWVRTAIVEALGSIGDESVAQDVLTTLQEHRPGLGKCSKEVLKRTGAKLWAQLPFAQSRSSAEKHELEDESFKLRINMLKLAGPTPIGLVLLAGGKVVGEMIGSFQETKREELTDVRRAAAEALGRIGDRSVVPALLASLREEDDEIREATARALACLGLQPVLGEMPALLRDADSGVRGAAVRALARSEDDGVPEHLLAVLDEEPRSEVRVIAIAKLGEMNYVAAMPRLRAILRDCETQRERVAAAHALGVAGDVDAVPDLIRVARNELRPPKSANDQGELRLTAVRALGALGDSRAVASLIEILENKTDPPTNEQLRTELRRTAVQALGSVGNPTSTSALLAALQDPSVLVQAAVALANREDIALVHQLQDALQRKETREQAIQALGEVGARTKRPTVRGELARTLLSVLHDEDKKLRLAGAEALGQVGDATVVPHLMNALNNEDWFLRRCITRTLGQIGDCAAIPKLRELLSDKSKPLLSRAYTDEEGICDVAASALVSIGTPEALAAAEHWHRDRGA